MPKGVVVSPEVRAALPTDKLRRMHFVGWYFLGGYGVLRPDMMEVVMTGGSQASAPAYPW